MEFRILGPLEVVEEGNPVALGTLKERLVLAVLLLHANEFVSRERLIDDLWGEAPPPTAREAVYVYVSKLRKTLTRERHDPIATASGGYRLHIEPENLDLSRMHVLVGDARELVAEGEMERAAARFQEALSLWRGPTLAGLQLESLGRDEVAGLEELRLTALMDRIDCDLALGRHEQVLGELGVLVREHPLRERLRAQQMLALYRADRQVEALDAYAAARHTLVDELGIEPSGALQRLQQAILRHDASLETASGTATTNGLDEPNIRVSPLPAPTDGSEATRRRQMRPRRWQLALTLAVLLVGSAAAAILSSSAGATPHVVPNSLVRLDPRSGKVVAVVRVGALPGPIAVTPRAVWTLNNGDNTVSRYDLHSETVQTRPVSSYQPQDLVTDAKGRAWLSGYATPIVTQLAEGGGASAGPHHPWKTVTTIPLLGPAVGDEAVGAGDLWTIVGPYTSPGEDDRVSVIDLATNHVLDYIRLRHATTAIAFGDGAAWVGAFISEPNPLRTGETGPSWLYEIPGGVHNGQFLLDQHPLRRRLTTHDLWGPLAIAVGEGSVWVLSCGDCGLGGERRTLLQVDPDTLRVRKRIPFYGSTGYLAAGAGSVWLTGPAGSVWQLDPKTDQVLRTIHLGNKHEQTCGITATPEQVWVAIGDKRC